MTAREAVEKAEDARIVSLRKQQQLAQEQERQEAAARQAMAQQQPRRQRRALKKLRCALNNPSSRHSKKLLSEQRPSRLRRKPPLRPRRPEKPKGPASGRAGKPAACPGRTAERQLRQQLLQQFNAVLPTRETPRGLVINMQDVLFATGKYQLTQPAQLALARLSGIVVSHPGLNLRVEGWRIAPVATRSIESSPRSARIRSAIF